MKDQEYFSHLYEIASHLNREYSLPSALRKSLEKIIELLELDSGWIWLAEKDLKSVYLAASHNLPPALSDHPERLSGWCYCISKYLSGGIEEATNISEISCTRLKDITRGTRNLKFHASIPIITNGQKIGLINLLHKENHQLSDNQLSLLNTISELIGIAVERTRLQNTYSTREEGLDSQYDIISQILLPQVKEIHNSLTNTGNHSKALKKLESLLSDLNAVIEESGKDTQDNPDEFHYPSSPLTKRELEVISLVRKGMTNPEIAENLFIAERTVKFHLSSILSKLFAKTRTEAVNIALQRGLLS